MSHTQRTILVVAGDPSGDLHGAALLRAFRESAPGLHLAAVGGPRMRAEADEFLEDLASRGMTGFWEPVRALPFFLKLEGRLKTYMARRRPIIVCIDYYGFNHRVLKAAHSLRLECYYYISPQVWASRPGRVRNLKRLVRKMFVIFPFEAAIYRKAGLPCRFVGHPLLDTIPPPPLNGRLRTPLRVGLLPGSRASEVRRHLPVFLEAFEKLRRHFPDARAQVFAAHGLPDSHYDISPWPLVREADYDARSRLHFAISSSGTATLETALLGIPMVVVYKLSWPTYAVARALIRVRHIAMVNILAGRGLVPELIQNAATADKVARASLKLLENPARYEALRKDLMALRQKLGDPGGAHRAAMDILAEVGAVV